MDPVEPSTTTRRGEDEDADAAGESKTGAKVETSVVTGHRVVARVKGVPHYCSEKVGYIARAVNWT
jgi:hypothetical protein